MKDSNKEQGAYLQNFYPIYKPNGKGTGGAIQFKPDFESKNGCIFINAANQAGEKSYDWGNKVIMKLGMSDIGKIMALLIGRTKECKLFHKSDRGQTTFDLKPGTSYGYMLRTTSTISGSTVNLPVSDDEAEILLTLLRHVVPIFARWVDIYSI